MTVLGRRVSQACANIVEEVEALAERNIIYANEKIANEKSYLECRNPNHYILYLDMNNQDVQDHFEESLLFELDHIMKLEGKEYHGINL